MLTLFVWFAFVDFYFLILCCVQNILLNKLTSPDITLIDFGSACFEYQTVYVSHTRHREHINMTATIKSIDEDFTHSHIDMFVPLV